MACVPTLIPGDKTMDLTPFMYTPLGISQHTRILRLKPSMDPKAPLHCSLQPVDLDTYPDYEALSYTWGTPEFTECLIVEQSGHCCCLKITPNLHHGLQRLRLAMTARYLWVDALCIDQSDNNDKAKQIPRMAQIYRQATNVIIWLGEYAAEAECLARLSKAVRRPHDELQLAETRKDCDILYSIPWFRRRWIIQEAVLNDDATILCGDSSTSITRLIRSFSEFEHGFPIIHKIAELRRGRIWNQPISSEILALLDSFAEAECSNDLDRLYAIAGLSEDVELVLMNDQRQEHLPKSTTKIPLPVDYEQDAKSLYRSFAKALVKHYEGLSLFTKVLVCASTRLQSPQHGGSWFPCWNMPVVRQPLQRPPQGIFSKSSAFADSLREGSLHQIVSCVNHEVVADHEVGAAQGETRLRITDLSMPCPAACTASELCTWIQSVFSDIMKWARAVLAEGKCNNYTDHFFPITLFGVMTEWHFSQAYSGNYEPDRQDLEVFNSICMGTKSITESDLNQSPLREITRIMRGRRVVKWDRGVGATQNARVARAEADLHDLAQSLHKTKVEYLQSSLRIGIAPDFANINDELIVGWGEQLDGFDVGAFSDSGFGWDLNHGFVLRLSDEKCDYSHKGVRHYKFIGEGTVADDWALDKWHQSWHPGGRKMVFDICLH